MMDAARLQIPQQGQQQAQKAQPGGNRDQAPIRVIHAFLPLNPIASHNSPQVIGGLPGQRLQKGTHIRGTVVRVQLQCPQTASSTRAEMAGFSERGAGRLLGSKKRSRTFTGGWLVSR